MRSLCSYITFEITLCGPHLWSCRYSLGLFRRWRNLSTILFLPTPYGRTRKNIMQKQIQPKHAHFHLLLLLTQDLTWCSGPSEMLHYFLMPTLNCEPLELENCFINLPSVLKQGWHVSPIHLTTFAGKRRKNCTCREDSNFWPLFTRQKCGAMTWTMIGPVEASLSRAYFWGR